MLYFNDVGLAKKKQKKRARERSIKEENQKESFEIKSCNSFHLVAPKAVYFNQSIYKWYKRAVDSYKYVKSCPNKKKKKLPVTFFPRNYHLKPRTSDLRVYRIFSCFLDFDVKEDINPISLRKAKLYTILTFLSAVGLMDCCFYCSADAHSGLAH